MTDELYTQWLNTALAAELPAVSTDTAAKLLAITLHYGGGNEDMTMSPKYRADMEYIQRRWHIEGGETPDADMVEAVKDYSEELAAHEEPPEWCKLMMQARYNITLH